MPSFKPKPEKKIKINKKTSITLDSKHKDYINEFTKDDKDRIPFLKEEKNNLFKQLTNISLNIEQQLDLKDKIEEITKKIKKLQSKKKDYYLDNSKYIFEYFENKKSISSKAAPLTNKNTLLENFFKIKKEDSSMNELKTSNIVQKYLSNLDENFIDMNQYVHPSNICQYCNNGELIPLEDEGVLLCNSCSRNILYLVENDKPSYKEPPKEVCFYAYKRINHFKEIIAQFQVKETTQIPQEVIENIKQQIKKERIDISEITNSKTKEILKKLSYNKFYEHIPYIKEKLGIPPPIMTIEFEETLFNLFIELQAPYSKFCPDDRVNFLNYYYTAYKLCELLGETQYLEHFPMLKDREKRIDQDNIWKKICEELNWEFIPTI